MTNNTQPLPRSFKVLAIEGNASCQLRCPTCPTTSKGYPPVVGSGYLRAADFTGVLDSLPSLRRVDLECRGELFLNPELLEIFRIAYDRNVSLTSSSGVNLNTVKPEVLEGLVKYRVRTLSCAIDGASPEIYAIHRRGGDFNTVIGHLRIVNEYKRKYRSKFPRLSWIFVVFGHNEHELPKARAMAKQLGMDFVPKMSWDSSLSPVRDVEFVKQQTGWPAVTREEYANITGADYARGTCSSLWQSPHVNWDGKILGCCWNSWMEFGMNAFGDGYTKSIIGERITYARAMLLGEAPPRDDIPCAGCDLYKSMARESRYLTINEIRQKNRWYYHVARHLYYRLGIVSVRRIIGR